MGRWAQDSPLVAEIGCTHLRALPGGWYGQIGMGAPVMFDFEGLGGFWHPKGLPGGMGSGAQRHEAT